MGRRQETKHGWIVVKGVGFLLALALLGIPVFAMMLHRGAVTNCSRGLMDKVPPPKEEIAGSSPASSAYVW